MSKFCLLVVGPTAVGKSSFVYDEITSFDPHVISADSMQVYRGLNVLSASPSEQVIDEIPHTGVNELEPAENYDVSRFVKMADRALESARENNRLPVLVGGTAMYVQKFLYGLDEMPGANSEFRRRLRERADSEGRHSLHEELRKVDPGAAEKIHPNDLKRVIRALEIYNETGKTKTELTSSDREVRNELEPLILRLKRPPEKLRERIRDRVDRMVDSGLVEEVSKLLAGPGPNKNIRQAIGFDEAAEYLESRISLDELRQRMVKRTKELARKQESWFERLPSHVTGHPEKDRKELVETVERQV